MAGVILASDNSLTQPDRFLFKHSYSKATRSKKDMNMIYQLKSHRVMKGKNKEICLYAQLKALMSEQHTPSQYFGVLLQCKSAIKGKFSV